MAAIIILTNSSDLSVYIVNHRGMGIVLPALDSYVIELTYPVEGESKEYLQSYYDAACVNVNQALGGNYVTATYDIPADWGTTVTVPEMGGATATQDGSSGVVPAPHAGDQKKVLTGAGAWQTLTDAGAVSEDKIGAPNGVAALDASGKIPLNQIDIIQINGVDLYGNDSTFVDLGMCTITQAELQAMWNS